MSGMWSHLFTSKAAETEKKSSACWLIFLFINFFARQFTFGVLSWIFLELLWLHGSKAKSKQADIGACDWLQGHRLLYVVFVCSHDVLPPFFSSLIWTVYFLLSDNYRQVASFQEGSGLKGSRDRLSLSLTHTHTERERVCLQVEYTGC